jgi:hypothetical protein
MHNKMKMRDSRVLIGIRRKERGIILWPNVDGRHQRF